MAISPESISVTLAKDAIAALLGLFLTSELPVEIQDTSLELGYEGGNITLGLETGVEVFELSLGIDRFRVAVDSSEMGDFTVNAPDASDYYMTEAGMPTNINLSLGAEIGINSEPAVNSDRNTIDLSPALSGLLGDVELNVLIEFLGLIDEKLFLTVDGSINLEEIVNIATNGFDFAALERTALMLRLSTYASADENDIDSSTGERRLRTVMSIYYIEGDLYLNIDTSIVGLDHIMIPDANEVISSLISSVTGGGAAGDVSNAPYLTEGEVTADEVVYTYIDLALADGGLSLTLTKDFLMGIFLALGLDIGSYLESLNLEVSAAATLNPLEISLSLGIQDLGDGSEGSGSEFVELSASIGDLSLGFDTELTIPDDEKAEYAFTARYYHGAQRYLSGLETTTRLLFHAAWMATCVVGAVHQHWLATGLGLLLLLMRLVPQALIINHTARNLGEQGRYGLMLPAFDFAQPLLSLRWKWRARKFCKQTHIVK